MKFTLYSTMNDILGYEGMSAWLPWIWSGEDLQYFPREYFDEPLALIRYRGKTPWGTDLGELTEELLDAANLVVDIKKGKKGAVKPGTGQSWSPMVSASGRDIDSVFLLTPKKKKKPSGLKPVLLIVPGGAYRIVSFKNEGNPIAARVAKKGYLPFILRYRVSPSVFPSPQMDLVEALVYLRKHAAEYGGDPDRIGLVGFSAGAHLAASCLCLYSQLAIGLSEDAAKHPPKAAAFGYPVITLEKGHTHEETFRLLTGGDESLRAKLSVENMIPDDFPPAFVWTCSDDETVPPENAGILKKALDAKAIGCEMHIYPQGGHGCGLAFGTSAWEWSGKMLEFFDRYLKTV